MFGLENMTDCTEVTERLAWKGDGWEMTRTFTYADGRSESHVSVDDERYHILVPAAPGWIAVTNSYYDAEATRDQHPVAMWKYWLDDRDSYAAPIFPGDTSMTHAVAVISPDGRVFEVSNNGCLQNTPYPSVKAWHDHVERKRTELLAEQERRQLESEQAARSIVFRDGSNLADVRKQMAEEGFDVIPRRQDRCDALHELPLP